MSLIGLARKLAYLVYPDATAFRVDRVEIVDDEAQVDLSVQLPPRLDQVRIEIKRGAPGDEDA